MTRRSCGPLHLIPGVDPNFRLLATPIAVISGITYNFLPFMTLPVYVAVEKVDFRLVEAAKRPLRRARGARAAASPGALVGGGLATVLGIVFGWEPGAVRVRRRHRRRRDRLVLHLRSRSCG
jgi:hypothetical protein